MNSDLRQVLSNDDALRQTLRRLPRHTAPAGMTARLRAVAVQDRFHRQQSPSWTHAWKEARDRAHLAFQNIMRPLAVPAVGGVFSAVTLFNLWVVPAYPVHQKTGLDVPTQFNTDARFKGSVLATESKGDFAVDALVDDQGRMVDYTIVTQGYVPDASARRQLVDVLSRTTFEPATKFGRPKMGKIRLKIRLKSVDVKG